MFVLKESYIEEVAKILIYGSKILNSFIRCSKIVLSSGKRGPINALAVIRSFIPGTAEESAVLFYIRTYSCGRLLYDAARAKAYLPMGLCGFVKYGGAGR